MKVTILIPFLDHPHTFFIFLCLIHIFDLQCIILIIYHTEHVIQQITDRIPCNCDRSCLCFCPGNDIRLIFSDRLKQRFHIFDLLYLTQIHLIFPDVFIIKKHSDIICVTVCFRDSIDMSGQTFFNLCFIFQYSFQF